ncbi:hypothetical protein LZZ85_23490 [Terrimonas sp. NA20]|uniref:DUF1772 domain-containing protein n=1 Tax=Terrimonas ginsenosidimutans TaxID=2908004 RepID=A0ABS9KY84_9BACT|nr:hypothetical protein [Terrimonas ginsenosidimutans]MCG2617280.1 hypothetical protein [Terrimonas ginsenosidimutans]
MLLKNIIYSLTCLSFSVVIGAAIYEHIAVVPQWSAGPPLSLSMFQGKYGLNPTPFWKSIHPVTMILLLISIVLFWSTERRTCMLITSAGYVVVLIITFAYFVPQLVTITGSAYSEHIDEVLTRKAALWEKLSLVRLSFLIMLAITLFMGLTIASSNIRVPKNLPEYTN